MTPRQPINEKAMTPAERKQAERDRKKALGLRQIWVTPEEWQVIEYGRTLAKKSAPADEIQIPEWLDGLSNRNATALLKQGYDLHDLMTLHKGGYDWAEVPNIGRNGRAEIDDWITKKSEVPR